MARGLLLLGDDLGAVHGGWFFCVVGHGRACSSSNKLLLTILNNYIFQAYLQITTDIQFWQNFHFLVAKKGCFFQKKLPTLVQYEDDSI